MTANNVTAAQIADAMGVDKKTISRRAQAEGWTFVEQPGRGGMRRLYTVDQLPAAMRAKLTWKGAATTDEARAAGQGGRSEAARLALTSSLEARAAEVQRQGALTQASGLSVQAQARMDARLAVLQALEVHHAASGLPIKHARLSFALAYNAGRVSVHAAVRRAVRHVSDSSLERWQREVREQGIVALAGAYGNRAGTARLDTDNAMREFVRAMLVSLPHCRSSQILKSLRARFPGQQLPSASSLQRWVHAWREQNAEVLALLGNPDGWRNKYMTAFGSRSEDVLRVNHRWELDSSPADVLCTDGRYSLIAGIDVFSRVPRLLVAKTSKAEGVAALLRRMLLDLGVPEQVKTDNGSDYTSKHVVRVLAGLDVQHQLCTPFNPDQKPHIERFFGTFSRDLAEMLPGYIGHSVADRKAIEARRSFAERLMKRSDEPAAVRLTGKELQEFCDRWTETVYQHQPHEGLQRRTPFEVCATLGADRVRIDDERALDVLLAAAPENDGNRVVQKKGIKVDGAWFIAPELHAWVGEPVQVRFDALDHDLGRLYVFGRVAGMGDQSFVCIAECPERTGMDRREVAAKARTLQRQHVQAARRALKAGAKRVGTDELVHEVLRDRAAANGKLRMLPTAGPVHSSAGLAAAANAARSAAAPARTTADIEHLQAVQTAQARIAAEQVPKGVANDLAERRGPVPMPVFETVGQRIHWLLGQARTRALTDEERESLAEFRRTQPAAYRRMSSLVSEQMGPLKEETPGRIAGDTGAV